MKIKTYLILISIIIFLITCSEPTEPISKKPNIILITIDTLRADHLHCYGYKYKTSPNIDALAKKSIFFEYAFCPIPKTSASFASMMTGLHPFIHKTKPNRGFLKKKYLTLAEALKSKQYFNFAVVSNANLSSNFYFNQGFDQYIGVWNEITKKEKSTPFITKTIISFLEKNQTRPFFLWANYIEPHTPYLPPKEFVEKRPAGRNINKVKKKIIAGMRKFIKQNPDEGHYISLYDGAVKYIDAEIGKIIDLFFEKGYHKNSILIISSDHGEDLGEHNFYYNHGPLTFNDGARVPLIIFLPDHKKKKITYPVSIMDIYPTILKKLNIKLPYSIQGRNLFKGKKDRFLLILGQGTHAVVQNKYHYVKIQPQLAKKLNLSTDFLYNIFKDPYEKNNLFIKNRVLANLMNKKYTFRYKKYGYLTKGRKKSAPALSKKEIEALKTLGYL